MKVFNHLYLKDTGWQSALPDVNDNVQLVLCFGDSNLFHGNQASLIRSTFPNAQIAGCTTAGNIHGDSVHENDISLSVTAIEFERTNIAVFSEPVTVDTDCADLGQKIADKLVEAQSAEANAPEVQPVEHNRLRHVIVLSEGLLLKGDALSAGLSQGLPTGVTVTGGMAGQGMQYQDTRVWLQDSGPLHQVVAIGLYGEAIEIGYGSQGGFDAFGPKRKVTRSQGSKLFELDGQSALELYKAYLGEEAKLLPASGCNFPLSLIREGLADGIVRSVLTIDEADQSMDFAGDLPEGSYVQLMRSDYDRLIEGAYTAAKQALNMAKPELAFMVSCGGRRILLGNRVEEEVEDAIYALGDDCVVTGFYSYGEFCPVGDNAACLLHNQTMTITTIREN